MNKPNVIVVCGPTATGKSDLAVEIGLNLAKHKIGQAEIISADSRQVYRGLDIGSGKITKKEMRGVPHHLLNVCSVKKIFTVSDFQKLANKKIEEIIARGKVPIICGGTGFYIDSIVKGLVLPEVPPNKILRKKLDKLSLDKLFLKLKKLDPERAKTIDKLNKVRLVRAIEIATALGKVPKLKVNPPAGGKYNFIQIGLDMPDDKLKERIKIRLAKRMKQGMMREVKNLHDTSKVSWKRLDSLGLEYKYIALFLQKKMSKVEMLNKLETEIWHYVKRQRTWFRRDKEIIWDGAQDRI